MTHVPPDGPVPCEWAVVGSAPARVECEMGRGFVGPSGALLWPLMRRLALLNRDECYVTNWRKTPFEGNEDPPWDAIPEEERAALTRDLRAELARVRPRRVLAVGALAAKALLGDRYVGMDVCNGAGFMLHTPDGGWEEFGPTVVVPTWHPAAALRPGGEDRLAYTGAAIAALREPKLVPVVPPEVPTAHNTWVAPVLFSGPLGIDTEGTPNDAICMTVATEFRRWYIEPAGVASFFDTLPESVRLLFHNALWDWPVLWAMGAPRDIASRWEWRDTMEMAYLKQTEPRGLKDLAYRHLGLRMRTFDDVVKPHYDSLLRAWAEGRIEAGTTRVTHSPKTGKLLKRPKVTLTDEVKPLKRALDNPELLAKRMPGMLAPSLRWVPEVERVEYATLDAWVTVMMEEHLR